MKRTRIPVFVLALSLFAGAITAGPLAQPTDASSLKICGTVSLYLKATALTPGALTIGVVPYVIKAGTSLSALVKTGADLCFDLTLNLSGGITGAIVTANVTATVKICGDIKAYTKATADGTGSLKLAGRTFVLGVGSTLPASVKVGADICLDLTLDAFGRVQDGSVSANATATVKVCGNVTVFAEASLTQTGTLKIGGRSFVLGLGSNLPASIDVGDNLCATLTINGFGQVESGSVTANVTTTLEVCGKVNAVVQASATNDGSLKIAGTSRTVAAGTDMAASLQADVFAKVRLKIDVFGRISDVTVLAVGASLDAVCGAPATPTPPPTPKPTPAPTTTPQPTPTSSATPTARPTGSVAPTSKPSSTPAPSGSVQPTAGPESSHGPESSLSPESSVAPDGSVSPAWCGPGGGSTTDTTAGDDGAIVPDTASLARTAGVVLANGVPLAPLAAFGLIAGWLATRRRREAAEQAEALVESSHTDSVGDRS